MKKIALIGVSVVCVAGLIAVGYTATKAKKATQPQKQAQQKAENLPDSVRIKLPNGETVTAVRIPGGKQVPPEGTELILKGKVMMEEETGKAVNAKELVFQSETGEKYLVSNAAFVNSLRSKAIGKAVKLKGNYIAKTSFKDYPAIHVKDVLEVK